ncbi:hypothetical protein [Pseudofrankia inefficax]|uniref:DUF1795 domain-containing protein n=1 Tax=Pseudofrankia inefficax (strain DSM 45817 / CECT 9037 / DDB 130130 / EuI1c) TaxID=298654 RepID=E3IUP6_PSEI1|nr:hypothetical protein [Pseudofrankia inefficax]ADP84862.1 hypothetical protein FraEuI1c_6894 [Pseudofrankia inefficax]
MTDPNVPETPWRQVEKPEYGYSVWVPSHWAERPPNLKNSPWETARFAEPDDRRHSVIVFRNPVFRSQTPLEHAESIRESLTSAGFAEFELTETTVASRPGARIDCVRRDAGRVWAVREYLVHTGEAVLCLGLGSAAPDEDDALFDELAARWEVTAA